MDYAIGIDLGGTNVKAVTVTSSGQILDQAKFETADEALGAAGWGPRIAEYVTQSEKSRGPCKWIGVAAPGLPAADGRSIAWMAGRMNAVQDFDWTDYLKRQHLVPVINDAQAALMGEIWQGSAADARNAALLTLGTGVGGAVMCDGRLLRGQIGRAGHLGHISLDIDGKRDIVNTPGSLEEAIGECTLASRSGGRFATTRQLLEFAAKGDAEAKAIWLRSVRALACGIVSIINAVDPEVVILGGGVAAAGRELLEPLEKYLDEMEWRPHGHRVRLTQAKLGERAGALGAAYNSMIFQKEGGR